MTTRQGRGSWRARTLAIADPGSLFDYLPADGAAWVRRQNGFVAIGEVASLTGASIGEADRWWQQFTARLSHHTDMPGEWGTGPLAVGSFAFDPDNTVTPSRFVVPRVILGRRGDRSWLTVVAADSDPVLTLPPRTQPPAPPHVSGFTPLGLAEDRWLDAAERARARIAAGELSKVVLARGESARLAEALDLRYLARALATTYDSTWVYLLAGLVGASPEMLVRRQGGLATSRVLAGTIPRNGGEQEDLRLAASLARSGKNLVEHELAVQSVAEALAPLCSGMNVPDAPYVLQLPNVLHLASDITGVCLNGATALQLAETLHPSAAVCGTPTAGAGAAIAEIENLDRGRYAGPVGWIDARGDGEWAIALRCGQLAEGGLRLDLFAGCGIVAESDPAEEFAETVHKLKPMRAALET